MSEQAPNFELASILLQQALDENGGDLEEAALTLAASALWHMAKAEDLMTRLCASASEMEAN